VRLRGGKESAAVGPIHPAVKNQRCVVGAGGVAEIEIQMMQFGHAGQVAAEGIRIDAVALEHAARTSAPFESCAATDRFCA